MVFVIMDEASEEARTFTTDESRRKVGAIGAVAGGVVRFTTWAEIALLS